MKFREKGNKIQLIRTTHDEETNRSKSRQLGAIPRLARRVKPEVLEQLNEDEKKELQAFIDSQKTNDLLEGKLYSHRLPHIVALIRDYAQVAESDEIDLILGHLSQAAKEFNSIVRKKQRGAEPADGDGSDDEPDAEVQ